MLLNFCCVTHLYILNFIELTKTTEYRLKRDFISLVRGEILVKNESINLNQSSAGAIYFLM